MREVVRLTKFPKLRKSTGKMTLAIGRTTFQSSICLVRGLQYIWLQ